MSARGNCNHWPRPAPLARDWGARHPPWPPAGRLHCQTRRPRPGSRCPRTPVLGLCCADGPGALSHHVTLARHGSSTGTGTAHIGEYPKIMIMHPGTGDANSERAGQYYGARAQGPDSRIPKTGPKPAPYETIHAHFKRRMPKLCAGPELYNIKTAHAQFVQY